MCCNCFRSFKAYGLIDKGSTTIKFIPPKIKPYIASEKREIKIKVIDFIKNYSKSNKNLTKKLVARKAIYMSNFMSKFMNVFHIGWTTTTQY